MRNIETLIRENIKRLKPYSSARHEFKGKAAVQLDANENAFGSPVSLSTTNATAFFNRYPDPLQSALKQKISSIKGIPPQNIFLGNGSDEAIDLLIRIFCKPRKDAITICPPTYGMYEVSANINDVSIIKIPLLPNFELDVEAILERANETQTFSKLLFICSPNNPTSNSFNPDEIELLIQKFPGVIVVDEAYINYSRQKSVIRLLPEYSNLVILQTFSKAWGLAGLRLGMAFASETIIGYLNKVKPPYNINEATQQLALEALDKLPLINKQVVETVRLRNELATALDQLSFIKKIYPSDANFILVKTDKAHEMYNYLVKKDIIVRDRSNITLCEDCLRITIGTADENQILLNTIKNFTA